jgi:hypothetical protein
LQNSLWCQFRFSRFINFVTIVFRSENVSYIFVNITRPQKLKLLGNFRISAVENNIGHDFQLALFSSLKKSVSLVGAFD